MRRWVLIAVWLWCVVGCVPATARPEVVSTPAPAPQTPARESTMPPTGATVQGELGPQLNEYMTRLTQFGFSGGVLVAQGDQILLNQGYGMADRSQNRPITPDTVFSIGSITKQFTAAGILKLEMQGKLAVTDRLSQYIPHVPADKAEITLHHLLTHSAGFPGALGGDFEPTTRDDMIRQALTAPLLTPPGEAYRYSNVGYSLLGAIIELVSGQPYEQYLSENLFKPAGLTQTGYRLPAWDRDRLAHGYIRGEDHGSMLDRPWAEDGPYWHLRANGGIQSTLGDLYRWHRALQGDSVLSDAARQKLFAPHVQEGPGADSYYAYGWAIQQDPRGGKLIAHNGGDLETFGADFRRYVDAGLTLIVTSTDGAMRAWQVSNRLEALAFGQPNELPPRIISLSPETASRLAGTYRLPSGAHLTLAWQDGRLALNGDGQEAFSLLQAGRPVDPQRAADLKARTTAIETAKRQGDFAPLFDAFSGRIALERLKAMEDQLAEAQQAQFGAFKGFEVLGTAADVNALATTVRLSFERGTAYVQYMWGPEGLTGLRAEEGWRPGVTLWPESATEFTSFDITTPRRVRVRVETAGDGTPRALVVVSPSGETRAERV